MIENLLSFSAWQASSVGLEHREFRLRPLVKQIIENQQLALLSQRVRLDVNVEDLTVEADRGKLRLILENLLSNAIKYSPRGGTIHVRARARRQRTGARGRRQRARAFPPRSASSVFEAFYTGRRRAGTSRAPASGCRWSMEFVHRPPGPDRDRRRRVAGAHFRIRMPLRASSSRCEGRPGRDVLPRSRTGRRMRHSEWPAGLGLSALHGAGGWLRLARGRAPSPPARRQRRRRLRPSADAVQAATAQLLDQCDEPAGAGQPRRTGGTDRRRRALAYEPARPAAPAQLRYALMLAAPNHPAHDAAPGAAPAARSAVAT